MSINHQKIITNVAEGAAEKHSLHLGNKLGSGGVFSSALMAQISYLFLILPLLIIHVSCASVSSVSQDRERVDSYTSIENIEPRWTPFADGIDYFHAKVSSPKIKFQALRVDLTSPAVEIVVSGGANDSENSEGFLSARVSSFVRDNNLAAGINALPFDVSSAKEGQPIKNVGIVVSQGKLLSPANHNYDALVFYKDGKAAIVSQSELNSAALENIQNAAGGFHQILKDSELTERALNSEPHRNPSPPRHPRSAAGISADTQYLYLLVIDGRQAASIGATEGETAAILLALGSQNGINFDGGGSSALALRFPDGSVKPVNTPVHKIIPGQERAVAGCLGIVFR